MPFQTEIPSTLLCCTHVLYYCTVCMERRLGIRSPLAYQLTLGGEVGPSRVGRRRTCSLQERVRGDWDPRLGEEVGPWPWPP